MTPRNYKNLLVILKTKCLLVSFVDGVTNIHVDLSINNRYTVIPYSNIFISLSKKKSLSTH